MNEKVELKVLPTREEIIAFVANEIESTERNWQTGVVQYKKTTAEKASPEVCAGWQRYALVADAQRDMLMKVWDYISGGSIKAPVEV